MQLHREYRIFKNIFSLKHSRDIRNTTQLASVSEQTFSDFIERILTCEPLFFIISEIRTFWRQQKAWCKICRRLHHQIFFFQSDGKQENLSYLEFYLALVLIHLQTQQKLLLKNSKEKLNLKHDSMKDKFWLESNYCDSEMA